MMRERDDADHNAGSAGLRGLLVRDPYASQLLDGDCAARPNWLLSVVVVVRPMDKALTGRRPSVDRRWPVPHSTDRQDPRSVASRAVRLVLQPPGLCVDETVSLLAEQPTVKRAQVRHAPAAIATTRDLVFTTASPTCCWW
jgi:hypothetical protein